jgi:hypothetical protein
MTIPIESNQRRFELCICLNLPRIYTGHAKDVVSRRRLNETKWPISLKKSAMVFMAPHSGRN